MNRKPHKSTMVRNAVKGALGTTVAIPLLFAAMPASAQSDVKLGETTVDVSGYIKLDAVYDFAANQGATLLPTDVDDYGQSGFDEDANLGWTAKQTRLTITTTTPTAMGDVTGTIQMDMYANGSGFSDGGAPRIRLANLRWNNWLIGRAWTTFSNFNYGTSLNFAGPAGQIFSRQELIRYTFDLGAGGSVAVAVEDGQLDGGAVINAADTADSIPDLAVKYSGSFGMASVDVAALARMIEAENAAGSEESEFGWGLTAGGSVALGTGTTLMLQASYGEGIGRYIYAPSFGTPAAYFDSNGDLNAVEAWSAIATLSQKLTPQLTANLIFGYGASNAMSAAATGTAVSLPGTVGFAPDEGTLSGSTLAANLLYSPVDALTFGIEYDRVKLEFDGDGPGDSTQGVANRVQFSTIYNF